jgi:hypothetical protein
MKRVKGVEHLNIWTINMQRHPKTKGTSCRRQRTYHGFKDGDGRKARRLRRPASRLRGLTTIPILEVWAAVVVMPLYAYDKKDFAERSPLDSAHISCRLAAARKSAALSQEERSDMAIPASLRRRFR